MLIFIFLTLAYIVLMLFYITALIRNVKYDKTMLEFFTLLVEAAGLSFIYFVSFYLAAITLP